MIKFFNIFLFMNIGELNTPYYLISEFHIPLRIQRKVNQLTSSFMEHGFYKRYKSLINRDFQQNADETSFRLRERICCLRTNNNGTNYKTII